MIVIPPFARQWSNTPASERVALVARELKTLLDRGGPVLCPVLAVADDELRDLALELLTKNDDGAGKPLYEERLWRLRLVEGARPPVLDPQGRALPKEKAGKVLVVKVGNLGGDPKATRHETSTEWSGPSRALKVARREDVFRTVEVTAKPLALKMEVAVLVLRRYGVGVNPQRYKKPDGWKLGDDITTGQDQWLVEEVCEGAAETPEKTRSGRNATT